MSWIEKRAEFQKRFDTLSQQNIEGLIQELNSAISNYISRGGISQDPNNNPEYTKILELTQKAEQIKKQYTDLNDEIIGFITKESRNNDLAGLLAENGELQKQINALEKIQNDMKIDVDSAIARDELLRSRNTEITPHKLYLLGRPIRTGLIPYLWAIAVLFIGIGIIIFRITLPSFENLTGTTPGSTPGIFSIVYDFITSKSVLGSLLIASLVVILFLALKIAGVFGK